MERNTLTSRLVATLVLGAALAASSLAMPQGDHHNDDRDHKDHHAQDHRDHKDHHAQDHQQAQRHGHGNKHNNGQGSFDQQRAAAMRRHNRALQIQRWERAHHHRHPQAVVVTGGNNEWRQIAVMAGLVAAVGLLEHDRTLVFVGAAGALYSLVRYQHDLHSHDRAARLRAVYFSRPYFYRNGHRYRRVLVTSHGQKYYRFVR